MDFKALFNKYTLGSISFCVFISFAFFAELIRELLISISFGDLQWGIYLYSFVTIHFLFYFVLTFQIILASKGINLKMWTFLVIMHYALYSYNAILVYPFRSLGLFCSICFGWIFFVFAYKHVTKRLK